MMTTLKIAQIQKGTGIIRELLKGSGQKGLANSCRTASLTSLSDRMNQFRKALKNKIAMSLLFSQQPITEIKQIRHVYYQFQEKGISLQKS